jgi:hypothetical protein
MTASKEIVSNTLPSQHEGVSTTIKVMDYLHADELFTTPTFSKSFFDSLSFDGFTKFLDMVNGIERGIKVQYRVRAIFRRVEC